MENASKALVMAGGVLIGVLILTLMVALFSNASTISKEYEETKHQEAVESFNANFIKYVGKELTIHDVVTICNFAENNSVFRVTVTGNTKLQSDILDEVELYTPEGTGIIKYQLTIENYSDGGYISAIKIN